MRSSSKVPLLQHSASLPFLHLFRPLARLSSQPSVHEGSRACPFELLKPGYDSVKKSGREVKRDGYDPIRRCEKVNWRTEPKTRTNPACAKWRKTIRESSTAGHLPRFTRRDVQYTVHFIKKIIINHIIASHSILNKNQINHEILTEQI